MVTTQTERLATEREAELHVVAFYEDLTTGEWAKEIFNRIRSRVPRDVNARPSLWRLDMLEDDHLADLAVAHAANAAVVIVAAQGSRPLPQRLLDCLERALITKDPGRVGLVAALEETDRTAMDALPAYGQLQAVSTKAKLRFFSLPCGNVIPARSSEERFEFRSNWPLHHSLTMETCSYRAWGLNE